MKAKDKAVIESCADMIVEDLQRWSPEQLEVFFNRMIKHLFDQQTREVDNDKVRKSDL